jgi:hypothetical protein
VQGLLNTLKEEDECEGNHEDGGYPGNDVEGDGVGVFPHEIFAVDEKKNEDDDDW